MKARERVIKREYDEESYIIYEESWSEESCALGIAQIDEDFKILMDALTNGTWGEAEEAWYRERRDARTDWEFLPKGECIRSEEGYIGVEQGGQAARLYVGTEGLTYKEMTEKFRELLEIWPVRPHIT